MMQDGYTQHSLLIDWKPTYHVGRSLPTRFPIKGKHTPTARDIVGNFKSLLREPEVLVGLALTAGFFRSYFFSHFKFLQGVDPNIGTPGFLQFHIFVRMFLMHKDLDHLAQYQNESLPEMKRYVKRVSVLPAGAEQDKQHWKADQFFNFAKSENINRFKRWTDILLFFLAALSEAPMGCLVA
jgi:hypothetical protein